MEKKDDTQKENPVPPPKPPRLGQRPTPIGVGATPPEDLSRSSQSSKRKESPASTAGCSKSSKIKPQQLRLLSENAEDEPRSIQSPKRKEPPASTAAPPTPSKLIKLDKLRLLSEDAEGEPSDDSAISNMEVVPPRQPTSGHPRLVSEADAVEVQIRASAPERSQSFPQLDDEKLEDPRPFARLKHRNDSPSTTEDQEGQESAEEITPASGIPTSSGEGSTLSSSSPTHGQQEKPSTPEKSQSLPQRDQKESQG